MLSNEGWLLVADGIARNIYMEHCKILDKTIEIALRQSLNLEKISVERKDRIVHQFSVNMRGVK